MGHCLGVAWRNRDAARPPPAYRSAMVRDMNAPFEDETRGLSSITAAKLRRERVRLSLATLAQARRSVRCPSFDPARLGVGIVHIGVGAFHRAHQTVYTRRQSQPPAESGASSAYRCAVPTLHGNCCRKTVFTRSRLMARCRITALSVCCGVC